MFWLMMTCWSPLTLSVTMTMSHTCWHQHFLFSLYDFNGFIVQNQLLCVTWADLLIILLQLSAPLQTNLFQKTKQIKMSSFEASHRSDSNSSSSALYLVGGVCNPSENVLQGWEWPAENRLFPHMSEDWISFSNKLSISTELQHAVIKEQHHMTVYTDYFQMFTADFPPVYTTNHKPDWRF